MKPKILLASLLTFILVYGLATVAQADRLRYHRLMGVLRNTTASLADLSAEADQISRQSSDGDLSFAAEYLGTLFSFHKNGGFSSVSDVSRSGEVDKGLTAFVRGLKDPAKAMMGVPQWIWLELNKTEFERAARSIDERFGGFDVWGIGLGCLAGVTVGVVLILREKPEKPVLKAAPFPISPAPTPVDNAAPTIEAVDKY